LRVEGWPKWGIIRGRINQISESNRLAGAVAKFTAPVTELIDTGMLSLILRHADANIAATQVVKIIGKGAHRVQDGFRVPALHKIYGITAR
jgi:hypothetical protein